MNMKLKKILDDIQKTEDKIAELQEHLKRQNTLKQQMEDMEIIKSFRSMKLDLPVSTCNAGILDRLATVDHHVIADIDSHMACSRCIIGSLEEDQISRFCLRWRYLRTV